jgi:hypothetical protein
MTSRTDRLHLRVIPQHPDSTPDPETVSVPGPVYTGPVGPRLAVFDYNRDHDAVFLPATIGKDGTFPSYDVDDVRFRQLNAYAIAARAIALVEYELGRTLSWGFQASRLNVLPHAGLMRNAFYSEATKSIQLFSFHRADGSPYHTSVAHDVVAHETGHALLDAIRDRYTEITDPETAALHEAIGDLTAVMAALSFPSIQELITDANGELLETNLVADVADGFTGAGAEATAPLRNLAQIRPTEQFEGETNPHILSLKLSQAAYLAFRRLFELLRERGHDATPALHLAHRALQRMLVRGLDFLPPAGGNFADYARAILAADAIANPLDRYGLREALRVTLEERRIIDDQAADDGVLSQRWSRPDVWPVASRESAYLFLSRHRQRLALGRRDKRSLRDFVISAHHVTTPPRRSHDRPNREAAQIIISYEYPIDVEVSTGTTGTRWLSVWGGGTLVFDEECRLRYHAEKPVTRTRVNQARRMLESGIRLHASFEDADSRPLETYQPGYPYAVRVLGDQLTLRSNLAAGCTELIDQTGVV